jgi:hypothetical protein
MTNLQRIKRILQFNYKRGICKNSVDIIYYKILYEKYKIKNNF